MDPSPIYHQTNKYIETASGNKVSKLSTLAGSQNIVLNGKTVVMEGCVLRGDLASLKVGKNTVIRESAILRPPFKKFAKGVAFFPLYIGRFERQYCIRYLSKLFKLSGQAKYPIQDSPMKRIL